MIDVSRISDEQGTILIGFVIAMIIILFIIAIVIRVARASKPIQSLKVKIIDTQVASSTGGQYIIAEDSYGNRKRLITSLKSSIVLVVGDVGMIEFRGQELLAFQKEYQYNSTVSQSYISPSTKADLFCPLCRQKADQNTFYCPNCGIRLR